MKWIKRIGYLFLVLGIFFVCSAFWLVHKTHPLQNADVIMVLGSPSLPNGKASIIQKSRVDRALELYNKGFASKLIMTGGAAWNNHIESVTMKHYAVSMGVPESAILTEKKSINTDENVKFSFEILKQHNINRVIVVTSSFHTRRAAFLLRHFPLEVQTTTALYPTEFGIKEYGYAILNEYYGFLRHFIRDHWLS